MKRARGAMVAAFCLSISASAFAHGGMEHVMGTVKKVSATSITVTAKGKDVEVRIDDSTKFEGAPSAKELKPGERVVVHASKSGDGLHAEVVKSRSPRSGKHAPGTTPAR